MTLKPKPETFSIFLAYSAAGAFWGAFAASMPALQARSGLDTAGFGLLLLTMTSGAIPSMVIFGWFVERITRWALPGCLFAFATAAVVLGMSTNLTSLVLSLFLIGAASGALDIALNMRVSEFERSTDTPMFNRAHAMFPLAVVAMSIAAGIARDNQIGLFVIFGCVSAAIVVAASVERAVTKTASEPASVVPAARSTEYKVSRLLILLGLLAALGAFQEMAAQSWAAIFVETVLMASATIGGLAPAAFMLGLSAGRFGAHMAERRWDSMRVVAAAAAIGVPAFLLVGAGGHWIIALIGFFFAGMAVGPVEPNVYRTVTNRSDEGSRGATLSVVTTVAYVGYLISPPMLGAVAESFGWTGLWTLAALFAGSAILLATVVKKTLGEPLGSDRLD